MLQTCPLFSGIWTTFCSSSFQTVIQSERIYVVLIQQLFYWRMWTNISMVNSPALVFYLLVSPVTCLTQWVSRSTILQVFTHIFSLKWYDIDIIFRSCQSQSLISSWYSLQRRKHNLHMSCFQSRQEYYRSHHKLYNQLTLSAAHKQWRTYIIFFV